MKKILYLIFALFLLGCEKKDATNAFIPYKKGDEIVLKSVTNQEITLIRTDNGFKLKNSNKIIIFDIFATYCPPCQSEAPFLMDFAFKNKNVFLIGLIHFEKINNEDIINNFIKKYNGYYFISNQSQNSRIIEQILRDINYKKELKIPFKVMLKDGVYQNIDKNNKFYLGSINLEILKSKIADEKK